MNKEFVTYEQALVLKELGFDKPCFSYYNPNGVFMWKIMCSDEDNDHTLSIKDIMEHKAEGYVECPLKQQAFRFFREKYGILSYIEASPNNTFDYVTVSDDFEEKDYEDGPFKTYEEAEQSCLNKLIEMVKNKNE